MNEPISTQFHADNLSSAHIYLRLTPEQTWDALPKELVEECAQLTKANSIEGSFSFSFRFNFDSIRSCWRAPFAPSLTLPKEAAFVCRSWYHLSK